MQTRLIVLIVFCSVCVNCALILDGPVYRRIVRDGAVQADARSDGVHPDVFDAFMPDASVPDTPVPDTSELDTSVPDSSELDVSAADATSEFDEADAVETTDVFTDWLADVFTVDADAAMIPPDAGGPNLEIQFTDDPGQPVVRGLIVEIIPGGLDPPVPSLRVAFCMPPIVPSAMVRCLISVPVPLGANVRFNFFYSTPSVFPSGPANLVCHTSGATAPRCPLQASYYRVIYEGTEIVRTADYLLGSLPYTPWGGAIQYLSFIARP